jgi:hypothetical protein
MFKDLIEKLKKLSRERVSFDPSRFDDPIAAKTEWSPAKGGGASFKTHNLVRVNSNRFIFRSSIGARIFYSVFLLIGLGCAFGFSYSRIMEGTFDYSMNSLFPILFGSIFTLAGGLMLFFGTKPIVFENGSGYFWKGRKNPQFRNNANDSKNSTKLSEIHALQIIKEYVRGDKTSYHSYEINLVLNDASRINVVDHGKLKQIREDAEKLSQFLRKPVWDATL